MNFGENLKRIRTEKHLTQKYVAESMGISPQAYSQYERATEQPKGATLKRLSLALNVDIGELITDWRIFDLAEYAESDGYEIMMRMNYNQLNSEGKKKVNSYVEDLSLIDKYRNEQ